MDKENDEWIDDGRMRGWMDGRMNNHHDLIYEAYKMDGRLY